MGDFDTTFEVAAEAAAEVMGTESVTYTPYGGEAVAIAGALIRRMGIHPELQVPVAHITVRNDATYGIDAASIDTGGDTLAWPPKRGGANRTAQITAIVSVNAGFVTVEVV